MQHMREQSDLTARRLCGNSFPAPPVCWPPPTAQKHVEQVVVISLRLNCPWVWRVCVPSWLVTGQLAGNGRSEMQPAKIPFIANRENCRIRVRVSWFDKASRCPWTHLQVQRLQLKRKTTALVFNESTGVDGAQPRSSLSLKVGGGIAQADVWLHHTEVVCFFTECF